MLTLSSDNIETTVTNFGYQFNVNNLEERKDEYQINLKVEKFAKLFSFLKING